MTERLESYDNVFAVKSDEKLEFTFSDPAPDGDKIDVIFNGRIVVEDLELTGEGSTVDLPVLTTGANRLKVVSKNAGTISTSNQVKIDVPIDNNLYGDPSYTFTLMQGESDRIRIGLPKVRIDGETTPFAAQNIIDTLDSPVKLTIDNNKKRKDERRKNNINPYTKEFGLIPNKFDRDEVPPAEAIESGDNSPFPKNVRAIPQSDNKSAGGTLGNFIKNYGPDNIELENGTVIDFYATNPNYSNPKSVTGIIPIYGTDGSNDTLIGAKGNNDLIYGFDGNDSLEGDNRSLPPVVPDGNDTLLGGRGNDSIRGAGGNDIIVGEPDNDLLFGDLGNDVVYGGPGDDVLYGDNNNPIGLTGKDKFVLRGGEGVDLIRDFDTGNDLIVLGARLQFSTLGFRQISKGKRPDGEVFELPDYPSLGSSRGISDSGTEIFLIRGEFEGYTLAYVENISETAIKERSLFKTTGKIRLPSPVE